MGFGCGDVVGFVVKCVGFHVESCGFTAKSYKSHTIIFPYPNPIPVWAPVNYTLHGAVVRLRGVPKSHGWVLGVGFRVGS